MLKLINALIITFCVTAFLVFSYSVGQLVTGLFVDVHVILENNE